MARISRPIGGDVASTWPVMMMSDIWSVNGISSQKPRPQASTTCSGVDGVATHGRDDDDEREDEREDERVRHPPLGPRCQRQSEERATGPVRWIRESLIM